MKRFTLMSAEGLTAAYVDGPDVIHDVSMQVAEHEIVAIIGSNGAGKSTFLRALCGSLTPRSGKVTFMDEDTTGIPASAMVRRGVSLVASGRQVISRMSVRDNLLVGSHVFTKDRRRVLRLLEEMFDRFPVLASKSDHDAATLSGGEQQLLVIARGLMSKPRLLLLDEPSLGLAPMVVAEIAAMIRGLKDSGITIVMVEKLAGLALSMSDRVAVFDLGRLVFFDAPEEAAKSRLVEDAYLGRSPGGS